MRAIFDEFGEYTGLRLNLTKTKVLMQGVGPWSSRLAGMSIVPWVKYLGALFGDVTAAEAYEKGLTVFESRCVLISRMPLSRKEKVQLIHKPGAIVSCKCQQWPTTLPRGWSCACVQRCMWRLVSSAHGM